MIEVSPEAQAEAQEWANFLRSTLQGIGATGTTTPIKLFGDELESIEEMTGFWASRLQGIPTPLRAMLDPDLLKEIQRDLVKLQQVAVQIRSDLKGDPEQDKQVPRYRTRWTHIAICNWQIIWERDTGKKASTHIEGDFYQFASDLLQYARVYHNHKHLIEDALRGYDPGSTPLPNFYP